MTAVAKMASALLTLLAVTAVIFMIFQIIPGDAALVRLGPDADPALLAIYREEMMLDLPPLQRYLHWVGGLLQGDLGNSYRFGSPVTSLIADRLPNTVALAALSFAQVLLLGLPLGLWMATRADKASGQIVAGLTQIFLAIPVFALAVVLMLIFSVWLGWLPISGFLSWNQNLPAFLRSLILPSLAISLPSVAIVMRYLLTSLQEQRGLSYARTARSKGLNEGEVLRRHLWRNALIPVLTILGVVLINTLGGSIVVEAAFSIPGIGQLLNMAIRSQDLPLVQGISFYIALIVVIGYFLLDILYLLVDPRIADGTANRTPGR